jgi:hypothetical protein
MYNYIAYYIILRNTKWNRDDMHSNKSDIISRKRDDINANRNFAPDIENELSPNMQKNESVINLPDGMSGELDLTEIVNRGSLMLPV